MRKIDTSFASSTAEQPLYAESLKHLEDGYIEAISSLVKFSLLGYTTNDVIILDGLIDSGTAGVNYNISAGSIYYNGEVYQVPASGVLVIAGNVAVLNLVTAYNTSVDPALFTDGVTHNVHQIVTGAITLGTSGSTIKDYSAFKRKLANPVFAKLTTVGSGAASTSFALTGWDASPIDADSQFTIATGRFTPKLGYWKLSCCVTATPSTTPTGLYEINIYKNGSLLDLVCSESFLGTNASRVVQFNNYVINQTVLTDYYTIVMTTVSGTYTYSSVQFTAEPLGNRLM